MKYNLHITVSVSEVEGLIKEYDGNLDRRLNFKEFQNFSLPATSFTLRDLALNRANVSSLTYRYRPLPSFCQVQLGELIQRELQFLRSRADYKRQLITHYDFIKSRSFRTLSRGKDFITVDDLIDFLIINGSRPTNEDLEAILRRCDHVGDQMMSY